MFHHYGSASDRHLIMAHQITAPELRQRAVTPDPTRSSDHHLHEQRFYPRSHSSSDARQWVAPQHLQAAVRPRSQTPQAQLPYMHHPSSKAPVAMLPPQILVNAPHEHYRREYSGTSLYDDPRTAGYTTDPNYGSLQRRRDERNQNGIVSGPAQV